MTAPTYSPAPWAYEYSPYIVRSADPPPDSGAELAAYEVFDDDGNKVFDTNEDMPAELQEANARLGAAAPRLLASLMRCANLLADFDESEGEEGEAYREALAAIHEATGKAAIREWIVNNVTTQENEVAIGYRFALFHPVVRFPDFVAVAGLTGVVTAVDQSGVWARMDQLITGAEPWDNQVHWDTAEDFACDTLPA